jgi:hypothetical protein
MSDDIDESELVRRLLVVINEGRRESTYKLALLLALIDWCTRNESDRVSSHELAELVLATYWRQVRPFPHGDDAEVVLEQGRKPKILTVVADLRERAGGANPLRMVRVHHPNEYAKAVRSIQGVLNQQPIPRLQYVGRQNVPFLYECEWAPKIGPTRSDGPDPCITLRPGALPGMKSLGPLIRPIVERVWVSDLVERNRLDSEEGRVREHLFGAARRSLPQRARNELVSIQEGRCFYCRRPIGASTHVDHFVPWSKHPNDSLENLLLSCRSCNLSKSDHLCSYEFVARWLEHLDTNAGALETLANSESLESDRRSSERIARGTYSTLRIGSLVWVGDGSLTQLDDVSHEALGRIFARVE